MIVNPVVQGGSVETVNGTIASNAYVSNLSYYNGEKLEASGGYGFAPPSHISVLKNSILYLSTTQEIVLSGNIQKVSYSGITGGVVEIPNLYFVTGDFTIS